MAVVIGTAPASVFMYGILKATENFLKSRGIEVEDYDI